MKIRSGISCVITLVALFSSVAVGQESNPEGPEGTQNIDRQQINRPGTVLTSDQQKVKQVQQALSSRGYDPGPADGSLNSKTQNALREFQTGQGLQPSGRLDQDTVAVLGMTWSGAGSGPYSEQNKALIRRFYEEVWGRGDFDVADETFADNSANSALHDSTTGEFLPGSAGQIKTASDFRTAFPDLRITIDVMLADDEFVSARWTMEGTNTGDWGKISATGKHVRFSGIDIFRFANGRVVEMWANRDALGLMQQLGVPVNTGNSR